MGGRRDIPNGGCLDNPQSLVLDHLNNPQYKFALVTDWMTLVQGAGGGPGAFGWMFMGGQLSDPTSKSRYHKVWWAPVCH